MKKRTIVIIIILILAVLLIPIKTQYKDGGTKEYSAVLYKIIVWHELNDNYEDGVRTGTEFHFFPNNFESIDYYKEKYKNEYVYHSYKGYFFDSNVVEKMTSKEDIDKLLKRINNLSEQTLLKFNDYTQDYFEVRDLVLVYFPLGSGSISSKLKQIKVDEFIEVEFEINNPEVGTTDMSGYLYLIEVGKNDKEIKAKYYSDNKEQEIKYCQFAKTYKVVNATKIESACQTVTFEDSKNQQKTINLCYGKYVTFAKDKLYKFTFTPHYYENYEDNINSIFEHFAIVKIEETTETINENICY